jgi:hypothetical protein
MNSLEKAVESAINSKGDSKHANKAYLEFIKANLIIPVEKNPKSEEPEVLFLESDNQIFIPVFSSMQHFDAWAYEIKDEINLLKLSGVDFLKGVQENIIVALNPGSDIYKEFNPAEIARMRSMVIKIF